ncbi:zinc ABC transporter substrate-binding protein [Janibacter alkaliphilus]|uniref:Zinc transport system substrate-binding protein n=1 Tax=Janibacter alkaliphilus TaxID=1069963 RepID=A0A852XA77_9MICO|nr:metal ABC transporter substrate-binding protein [Janibacter alkaliphilus]NYG38420.1 zinc transport system substrate-binding protein [Janibacter alkaliphilus]
MNARRLAAALAAPACALSLAACGDDTGTASDGTERLQLVTSLYPLQEALEQIGGDHVEVTNLTAAGAEPHDLELTPQDVLTVQEADAVVYLSEFQPAVDDAAAEADDAYDVREAADLDIAADAEHDHEGESEEEHAEHAEGEHAEEGHDHGSQDPHFWLDPQHYAGVVDALGEHLAEIDPEHAEEYRSGAADFRASLEDLDTEMREGLTGCAHDELVTGHTAFAYLADAYGFEQEGLTGLTPESEPSAQEMAELVEHVREHDVSTIYAETLVPTDVADTIAAEAGVEVAVLDPIEGLTDSSAAEDYLGIMRANLATLQEGQECA